MSDPDRLQRRGGKACGRRRSSPPPQTPCAAGAETPPRKTRLRSARQPTQPAHDWHRNKTPSRPRTPPESTAAAARHRLRCAPTRVFVRYRSTKDRVAATAHPAGPRYRAPARSCPGARPVLVRLLPHSATAPDPQLETRRQSGTKQWRPQLMNELRTP
jgi:hypothetical protein